MAIDQNERAAQQYADQAGWPVFPCAPGSKLPAIRDAHKGDPSSTCRGECGRDGHGLWDATTDPAKIHEWWSQHPERNIGIATGSPGPDVIDVDIKMDRSGMPSWNKLQAAGITRGYQAIVRTPGTGIHSYYTGTDQQSGRLPDQMIDFRARGGYVVAPPSKDSRGAYVVVTHCKPSGRTVDWQAVKDHLVPPQKHVQSAPSRGDQDGSLDRLASYVAKREEGDRNFPLFYAAKQLQLQGQLDGPAVERLVGAAKQSGLRGGEQEARRTIESGRRNAMRTMSPKGGERGQEKAS
jgi:Bifunctional DNA primase/polymerase, N-terminal